jgi:hypothetical protein
MRRHGPRWGPMVTRRWLKRQFRLAYPAFEIHISALAQGRDTCIGVASAALRVGLALP